MSSLFRKLSEFAKSPKAKELQAKAKEAVGDPKNKAKAQEMINKVKGRKSY